MSYVSIKSKIVGRYRHSSDSIAGGILSRGDPTHVIPSRKSMLKKTWTL
jgi:hypothetical protein